MPQGRREGIALPTVPAMPLTCPPAGGGTSLCFGPALLAPEQGIHPRLPLDAACWMFGGPANGAGAPAELTCARLGQQDLHRLSQPSKFLVGKSEDPHPPPCHTQLPEEGGTPCPTTSFYSFRRLGSWFSWASLRWRFSLAGFTPRRAPRVRLGNHIGALPRTCRAGNWGSPMQPPNGRCLAFWMGFCRSCTRSPERCALGTWSLRNQASPPANGSLFATRSGFDTGPASSATHATHPPSSSSNSMTATAARQNGAERAALPTTSPRRPACPSSTSLPNTPAPSSGPKADSSELRSRRCSASTLGTCRGKTPEWIRQRS